MTKKHFNYADLGLSDYRAMSDADLIAAYDGSDEYIEEMALALVERADLVDDWEAADGETFEAVLYRAVTILREALIPEVKKIRERACRSMTAFAQIFGIPYRTLQGWESTAKAAHRDCPDYVADLLREAVERDNADILLGRAIKFVLVNQGRGSGTEMVYEHLSEAMSDFRYYSSMLTKGDRSSIYLCTRECTFEDGEWKPGLGDDLTIIAEYTPE